MPRQDLAEQGERTRAKIINFLSEYIARNGVSPALTEIASGVGLASHNAVRNHLLQLQNDGKVTWLPGKFRTLRLTAEAEIELAEKASLVVKKPRRRKGAA